MTGLVIFIMILLALIAPEIYLLVFAFIAFIGYGILEFILRLFGKSFDGEPTDSQIKDAYINYCDSHVRMPDDPEGKTGLLAPQLMSVIPQEHNYESFAKKCREDKEFYRKYKTSAFKFKSDNLDIKF
jgi:hypothetical protein